MTSPIPPHVGPDIFEWARSFSTWTRRALTQLVFKPSGAAAIENGTLLWDEAAGYPVVSKGGEWRQIVLEDGHYSGAITVDQTAAVINTAYALTYTLGTASGITNGTPASRLVVSEGGEYVVNFSAQISSTSSSTVSFWFWPRVNGSDVAGSTMVNALHQNGATLVVSRSAILNLTAGDYLEAMWAVDSTSGFLDASAATAFAPAAPATTISITRLHG
tara:strand:+ start:2426 stop:3079 length:654 start_codon:yes stop_codon:yes gene_type:complete